MTPDTYSFTILELDRAAENVREVLTQAALGRDVRHLDLLRGSKAVIRQAIYDAIVEGKRKDPPRFP